ncbi:hypothetical protein [Sinorhizobium medicae]|uniref:hypothetical protein n=1 Tax=Sinorhizobium medicae TaxID=110321 RepID=UPI000C7BF924|nr:hypothetical protein [Sinorhizobium medicae]MDX0762370.1 hypothetical protein [Sinorhizobium medicae]MDX0801751.1 hypothetical protein [Sinorhizobium medicae]MDX0823511.1 hypothetical protein [Sinorhizobium medicae]MDX0893638.1 hypothetical protein [Sinorhizobium medicae]MDX0935365.1 hypothetical protein [Sinorhizobium medicae]
MDDKFEIVDMKNEHGNWTVKFANINSVCGFGALIVRVEPEIFIPSQGMHKRSIEEVVKEAHKEVANDLYRLFKRAVISIPGIDWENVRSLTVSEILNELGMDDG